MNSKIKYYCSYIIYRIKANSAHGTHSPFVFDLYNQVIYPSRKGNKISNLKLALSTYPKKWEAFVLIEDIKGKNKTVWKEAMENQEFTVTIDLFVCGLAFIRPQQRKEHFILKF